MKHISLSLRDPGGDGKLHLKTGPEEDGETLMFVGHYSAALAAKAVEPRAPLWTYVAAAQLVDIGWSALVIAGVEKVRIDPSLPGSDLDLYFMPYTHSLPGALLWALAAALLARWLLKLPVAAAAMVGLTVFSHWFLDFLVHRPDLPLWFGGPKVGLAWWNHPLPEMALEIGLVAVAGAAWAWRRGAAGRTGWPALTFVAILAAVAVIGSLGGAGGGDAVSMGVTALVTYLVLAVIAWLVDRGPKQRLA